MGLKCWKQYSFQHLRCQPNNKQWGTSFELHFAQTDTVKAYWLVIEPYLGSSIILNLYLTLTLLFILVSACVFVILLTFLTCPLLQTQLAFEIAVSNTMPWPKDTWPHWSFGWHLKTKSKCCQLYFAKWRAAGMKDWTPESWLLSHHISYINSELFNHPTKPHLHSTSLVILRKSSGIMICNSWVMLPLMLIHNSWIILLIQIYTLLL